MPVKYNTILVVGAGIAGSKAACELAELGFDVHLLESAPNAGGKLQQHDRWFPTDDCTMCQSLPYLASESPHERCMRRVLAFPGVTLHPYSELESLTGEWGDFTVKIREKSRLIRPELCNACGRCAEVCPVEVPDAFQGGLATRKAAYIPYPGAYPDTYTIDPQACNRCGECVNACPTNAVDLELADNTFELNAGAVILAPGFTEFDPALLPSYGYGRFPNVVTSTQFERITAGGGITPGKLTRPSDGEVPGAIAFLTCVGSRDTQRPYCSYACCMYTLKEAILARELHPEIDAYIFYMDMRAFGKEWWLYYRKARRLGINFVRCRIASVEDGGDANLKIAYEDESGEYLTKKFGMVVLAAGQVQPDSARKLAEVAGVEIDEWGFCKTDEFKPVQTGKAGIFVAGAFGGPADIATTVTQAQSAALQAASLLWALRKPAPEPPEPRAPQEPRSAIFVVGEGVAQLAERVAGENSPDYLEALDANCPAGIVGIIAAKLKELPDVDRAVIAAPLSWSWEALAWKELEALGFAPNKVEFVDTRAANQDAIVHMVRAALTRLTYVTDAARSEVEVTPAALVVGGAVAALTAARALSALDFRVHLVNSENEFGALYQDSGLKSQVSRLKKEVDGDENICKYLGANLRTTAGSAGRFVSTIETADGPKEVAHGALILTTGAKEYDHSGDGYPEGVITQGQFEKELLEGKKDSSSVVMIQCIGTLNEERPYCSRVCCAKAIKNALAAKEANPKAEVFVLCREVMTYGLGELAYKEARDRGVIFIRCEEGRPPAVAADGDKFKVRVYDPVIGEEIELPADKVVLSTGTVSADAAAVAKAAGIQLDQFGFFKEANPKFRPVETERAGIFICGLAQGPQSMAESITQAQAASARAAALLARPTLLSGALSSTVADRWCVGCELCVTVCPVHARVIDIKTNKAKVYGELCVACGACATVCPSSAAKSTAANDRQILSTIEILTSK